MASKDTILLNSDFDAPAGSEPGAVLTPVRFQAGALVGGLRIMRPLGQGGMGAVWVARDETLGRRVALKVLHASTAHLGNMLLREAQTTAHFSHPHIVQIYATGVHQGAVWLSLELIDGGSLRQRLRGGPLAALEGARLLRGVADALSHAHQTGVVHQDLKPENVLIGTDGRARVADFGLARRIEVSGDNRDEAHLESLGIPSPRVAPICGTPPYMAPEQFRGEPPSPAADVWAFGVLMWEVLRNDRPFDSSRDAMGAIAQRVLELSEAPCPQDLPPALAALVQRCLSPDPTMRPSAHELCSTLEHFVRPVAANQDGPPFRGLTRFTESGSRGFYGREAEVCLLVEQVRLQPILPLVGPSGTGKSSLVLGGLVPRLREQGTIWLIETRPGHDPFGMLTSALRQNPSHTAQAMSLPTGERRSATTSESLRVSAAALRADPFLLGRLLRTQAAQLGRTAVLFVDQLEELLASSDHETRLAYLRSIVLAADDPIDPVRVILTLRDDFLGRLALDADIQRGLSRVCVVQPPGPASLRHILQAPIQARGFRWEDDAMVDRLVAATDGLVASLPLLQVAGALLWEHRDPHRRVIPRAALDAIGGLHGAIASHADVALAGISQEEQATQRRLLLRLVTPDETRAVLPLSQLRALVGPGVDAALERLVTHRLVNLRRAEDGDTDVELVHEALITHWHQLRRWLDEGRADHRLSVDVEEAAQHWSRQAQSPDACLTGNRLLEALSAHTMRSLEWSPLADRFLEASAAHARAQQRLRRLAAGGVAVLFALLVVVLAGALWQREERLQAQEALVTSERVRVQTAQRERDSATAALLLMRSGEDSAERRNAAALARAAAGLTLARQVGEPELEARLWEQLLSSHSRALPMQHIPPTTPGDRIAYTALSRTGVHAAIAEQESGAVQLVDVQTGETIATHSRCAPTKQGGAWSSDGTRLAHQCLDSFGVQVMDASGELLQELPCGPVDARPGDWRGMVAWLGGQLFVGAVDGICVFEGTPLQQTRFLELEGEVVRLSVSDRWVAAGLGNAADGDIASRVWDRVTGEVHLELTGDTAFLEQHLVTDEFLVRRYRGTPDHLEVWSLGGQPRQVLDLTSAQGQSGGVTFDATSEHLIAPLSGQLRRWDTVTWEEDTDFALEAELRKDTLVSPDGRFLVALAKSGRVQVSDATSGAIVFDDTSLQSKPHAVVFLDSDRLLVFTSTQGAVLWDLSPLPQTIIPRPARVFDERIVGTRYWWLTEGGAVQTGTAAGEAPRVLGAVADDDAARFVMAADSWAIIASDGVWSAWSPDATEPEWSRPALPGLVGAASSPDEAFVAVRTRAGMLIVLDRSGEEVLRKRFVSPGDLVVDGQSYGKMDPAFTTAIWAPDSSFVLGEQLNSGERWQCHRADWSCRQWPHIIRQSTMVFSPDGQRLYDRAIEHTTATETYRFRRLEPETGAVLWTWQDERLKTHVSSIAAGTDRMMFASTAGQVFALTADGEFDHVAAFHSDNRSLLSLSLLPDERRVIVAESLPRETMWIWDADQQRLAAKWEGVEGGEWQYVVARPHPQPWATLGDRALIPLSVPPVRDIDETVQGVLDQSNLRICRESLAAVAVVPYPDAESPWAPPMLCDEPLSGNDAAGAGTRR